MRDHPTNQRDRARCDVANTRLLLETKRKVAVAQSLPSARLHPAAPFGVERRQNARFPGNAAN